MLKKFHRYLALKMSNSMLCEGSFITFLITGFFFIFMGFAPESADFKFYGYMLHPYQLGYVFGPIALVSLIISSAVKIASKTYK